MHNMMSHRVWFSSLRIRLPGHDVYLQNISVPREANMLRMMSSFGFVVPCPDLRNFTVCLSSPPYHHNFVLPSCQISSQSRFPQQATGVWRLQAKTHNKNVLSPGRNQSQETQSNYYFNNQLLSPNWASCRALDSSNKRKIQRHLQSRDGDLIITR